MWVGECGLVAVDQAHVLIAVQGLNRHHLDFEFFDRVADEHILALPPLRCFHGLFGVTFCMGIGPLLSLLVLLPHPPGALLLI